MKRLLTTLACALATLSLPAANDITEAFRQAADSLGVGLEAHFGVRAVPRLIHISKNGDILDFHFNQIIGEYPWKSSDLRWFRDTLKTLLPDEYSRCRIGSILCQRRNLNDYATPSLSFDGRPRDWKYRYSPIKGETFVKEVGAPTYSRGLSGRNIALWQSHGRYFDAGAGRWLWQRSPGNLTCEDLFSQTFVLQYLIPMLENAGAYVMTPRERSTQTIEIVCDNDPAFKGVRDLPLRQKGRYSEKGGWSDAGEGFADTREAYMLDENPWKYGTARMISCDPQGRSRASWTADIPQRGRYPVYVSYKTLENSTASAHYTVHHAAGRTAFRVNQTMGGGTWVYLGTFDFDGSATVTLDNSGAADKAVSADAVRFGGGMGKTARGREVDGVENFRTSGLPAFAEGALYSMQWAGIDTTVTARWEGEYSRDYASRGAWVQAMSNGSAVNPDEPGRGIPIDMSLAFHTDAGKTCSDSLIGTLAIYTLGCDGKEVYANGRSREVARTYADFVQSQIKNDIDAAFDIDWRRREIWNRSYSESRTTGVPGMLLELLSHQNFADMRLGLDPNFKFTASRAVYKGMLKFLSELYGVPYTVQPLPVRDFAAVLSPDGGSVKLSWRPVSDPQEPTAAPESYILYTRLADGPFDRGKVLKDVTSEGGVCSVVVPVEAGRLYSWKLAAANKGGRSFPTQVLSAAVPSGPVKGRILVVDNFDRVSAPAWFDYSAYAGFDSRTDNGVPWGEDISFIGEQYEFRRDREWISNSNPGFGACRTNMAGKVLPGNTFDWVSIHAAALMEAGWSVSSAVRDAWCADASLSDGAAAVDIVCGKQRSTLSGARILYRVWPAALRETVSTWCAGGGGVIVSGAAIASDISDCVYPWRPSDAEVAAGEEFLSSVLGIKLVSPRENGGRLRPVRSARADMRGVQGTLRYSTVPGEGSVYCVENSDSIAPAGKGSTLLRYSDTGDGAAVAWESDGGRRCVSFSFPLEVISDQEAAAAMLVKAVDWISADKE